MNEGRDEADLDEDTDDCCRYHDTDQGIVQRYLASQTEKGPVHRTR